MFLTQRTRTGSKKHKDMQTFQSAFSFNLNKKFHQEHVKIPISTSLSSSSCILKSELNNAKPRFWTSLIRFFWVFLFPHKDCNRSHSSHATLEATSFIFNNFSTDSMFYTYTFSQDFKSGINQIRQLDWKVLVNNHNGQELGKSRFTVASVQTLIWLLEQAEYA